MLVPYWSVKNEDRICLLADGTPIARSHPPASHVGAESSPAGMPERPERAEEMIVIGYKMSFIRNEDAGGEEGLWRSIFLSVR